MDHKDEEDSNSDLKWTQLFFNPVFRFSKDQTQNKNFIYLQI